MGLTQIWGRLAELRERHSAPPLTAGSVASLATPTTGSDPEESAKDSPVQFSAPVASPRADSDEPDSDQQRAEGPSANGSQTTGHSTTRQSSPALAHPEGYVPHGLRVAASWAWRLILVAILVYGLARIFGYLSEVVVPLAIAILLAAMLGPVAEQLRRWGLHRGASTAVTVLGGLALIAGALTLIISQIVGQAGVLSANVGAGFRDLSTFLQNSPLHVSAQYFRSDLWLGRIQRFVSESESSIAGYAAEIGAQVGHFLAGFAITLFALFYFLYDGRGIFAFLLNFVPREVRPRVDQAADKGWRSLSHYVRATILVALSDAIGILIAALILHVPVAPALAALVFIGAFVPLVGAFVSGFVAVAVAFVAVGWVSGLIMFGAIILVMQVEGHLLQPFLLGRAVKLHPLAVLLAIAVGIVIGGIVGALIAVPILAFTKSFVQYAMGAPEPVAVRFRWPAAGGASR